jgi:hypothetical protein
VVIKKWLVVVVRTKVTVHNAFICYYDDRNELFAVISHSGCDNGFVSHPSVAIVMERRHFWRTSEIEQLELEYEHQELSHPASSHLNSQTTNIAAAETPCPWDFQSRSFELFTVFGYSFVLLFFLV